MDNEREITPRARPAAAVVLSKQVPVLQSEIEFDPENEPQLSSVQLSSSEVAAEKSQDAAAMRISLGTIPVEILLVICDYLEAGFIINTLSKVCQDFGELFSNGPYWRIRLAKRWPKKYPAIDRDEVDWREVCMERERCQRVWSQADQHMEHFTYSTGFFAAVDVVHLMQEGRLLATGSRDRYLNLLDLTKYDSSRPETKKEMKLQCIEKAHLGWIWSMASLDNLLYTGSWDTWIRAFDLQHKLSNNFSTPAATYKCNSAVLSLHVEQNLVLAGCFDKKVYFIDPRQGGAVTSKRWHRQAVLCIAADDDYIISGSEDKSFCIYDRRAGRVFKSIKLENYPHDVSYQDNQLWFGDKLGGLTLIDTTMGKFEVVKTYDVGHKDKLTGVIYTEGAIFTCSNDKTIKVLEPSRDPAAITTLEKHSGGVAGIAYQNGVLASAGTDICVGIWRPKRDWGWSS